MASIAEIKRVKASVEKDLLNLDGVTGVGIGEKVKGGKRTGETSIRVYVKKKKPKSKVSEGQMIPDNIDGIPTDVIEREFELHPGAVPVEELELMVDTGRYDPLTGGISIGPCRAIGGYVFVGTLGLVVEDNLTGDPMMLSNFHVMCVDSSWTAGDDIAQPGRPDRGSCPADVVGDLTRASLGGQVDCAVARITNRSSNCQIIDIGSVNGTAAAILNEQVRKRGRTTELTHGFVDDVSLTVTINYSGIGNVTLTNQIGIDVDLSQSTAFGLNGDSGSVVVNSSNEVIGLYFAGNREVRDAAGNVTTPAGVFGVANPINAVFSALNIRLCSSTTLLETLGETIHEGIYTVQETLQETIFETSQETLRETIFETGGWPEQGGFTPNKRFDDVKDPSGYDTLMETIQEHGTFQEGGGFTFQEGIGGLQPRTPQDIPPYALSTPHHASGAARFEMQSGNQGRGQQDTDLDAEIERVSQYLEALQAQKRNKRA